MSWVTLDDNFPHHPKTIAAGAVAAWLFVCGCCYCRKFHTGGFIPLKALPTLGAGGNPRAPAAALVRVGLWEARPDGYTVHDYAQLYPDDHGEKVRSAETRAKKREAGRLGGLASGEARRSTVLRDVLQAHRQHNGSTGAERVLQPIGEGRGNGSGSGSVIVGEGGLGETLADLPLDQWLRQLQADYPETRVTAGYLTETAFYHALLQDPRSPQAAWDEMRANLENQKRGYEWRVKGMIPALDKWLAKGLWHQRHEETPASVTVSEKTAASLTAAAAFIKGGVGDE